MNIPILIAGILLLVAFFIHALVGDKEYQRLKPSSDVPERNHEVWVQVRSGHLFHSLWSFLVIHRTVF